MSVEADSDTGICHVTHVTSDKTDENNRQS